MGFGFFYDDENVYDNCRERYDNGLRRLIICATPLPHDRDTISHEFRLPSVYPDDDEFSHALNSSRCPHVTAKSLENFSDHIVALDDGKVLCLVSWGNKNVGRSFDYYTTYATLTFFKVTPPEGFSHIADWKCVPRRCFKTKHHADVKADGKYRFRRSFQAKLVQSRGRARTVDHAKADRKYISRRCFKAEVLHSVQFIIKTTGLATSGRIGACLL